jgi:hypothetical protein
MNHHQQALGQNQYTANEQYGLGYYQQLVNQIGQLRPLPLAPVEPQKPEVDYLAITRDVSGR